MQSVHMRAVRVTTQIPVSSVFVPLHITSITKDDTSSRNRRRRNRLGLGSDYVLPRVHRRDCKVQGIRCSWSGGRFFEDNPRNGHPRRVSGHPRRVTDPSWWRGWNT